MINIREEEIKFGKYKGETWEHVINEDPSYVAWCIDNVYLLSDEEKEELTEILNEEGYNWNRT
jgi:hypothetical protein